LIQLLRKAVTNFFLFNLMDFSFQNSDIINFTPILKKFTYYIKILFFNFYEFYFIIFMLFLKEELFCKY